MKKINLFINKNGGQHESKSLSSYKKHDIQRI